MISQSIISQQDTIIPVNGIELWTEVFGDKHNPPMLLIMGSGGQGILWPEEFCQRLANEGFFVIRYDNRDTGLSSAIDFNAKPYTLLDMANDVIGILDHYQLPTAHIVGASMGGAIAMILGAHYPTRVRSLSLLITSIDFRPACDLYLGKPANHTLPAPSPKIIEAAKKFSTMPTTTLEDKIQIFIEAFKLNCGSLPFDEAECRKLAALNFQRMKNPAGANNHFFAINASHNIHQAAVGKINLPTYIVHGDEDPVFPVEHGKATHAAIAGSTLCIVPGLGHNLAARELIYEKVAGFVKGVDERRKMN